MVLFYFKCEKCGAYQEIKDDSPTPESVPHIEYPETYNDNDVSVMVPICRKCYNKFKREWVTND